MKKIILALCFTMMFSFVAPYYLVFAESNEDILLNEDEFLYDIGYEDTTIEQFYENDIFESDIEDSSIAPRMGAIIVFIIKNGIKIAKHVYKSIKYAPKFPTGFKAVQNGTKNNTVNNKELLEELRQIESGTWKKVYKDGYDKNGKKVSIHYFQSNSGLVYDVKVKSGWSVKK